MLLVLFGRLGQMFIAVLAIKLATTFLSPSVYGQVSLLLSLTLGFSFFLVSPLGLFINRRVYSWRLSGKIPFYFSIYGVYLLLVCFIAAIMIFVLQNSIDLIQGIATGWIILIICMSIFFNTANQTFIPFLNLFHFRKSFVILTLATVIASLILSVVFVYYISPNAEYWQFGQVLGQAIFAVIGGIVFFRLLKFGFNFTKFTRPSNKMIHSLFAFSLPLLVFVVFTWAQQQSYRFVVGKMLGLEALGLFVAGYGVSAQVLAALENILITCFTPFFYQKIASGKHEDYVSAWQDYARVVFPVLLLTVGFLIVFASPITRILTGHQFHSAYRYVVYGALADAARVTVNTYAYLAQAQMKTLRLIVPSILGVIAVFVLIMLLAPSLKLMGTGLALVGAGVVAILAAHLVLHRQIEIKLPWKHILFSILFSLGFFVVFNKQKKFYFLPKSLVTSLLLVGFFGILYLFCIYILLKPMLHKYQKPVHIRVKIDE